jgi:hypothetical protein
VGHHIHHIHSLKSTYGGRFIFDSHRKFLILDFASRKTNIFSIGLGCMDEYPSYFISVINILITTPQACFIFNILLCRIVIVQTETMALVSICIYMWVVRC